MSQEGQESASDQLTSDPVLSHVVDVLVAAYRPLQVFLFGSMARGDAGPDSDYDLLLVLPDDAEPERLSGRLGYEALWKTGAAADVVLYRESHFKRRSVVPASLPATVLREGKLLHVA